jgi:tRNA nucleotidyltransferase (CCA-adding enzyme)
VTGVTPSDWDIATSATPADTKEVFKHCKTLDDGIKHGTVRVVINSKAYDITTFRTDGDYSDNRRPDYVIYTKDIQSDLSRRDFTINAMAYSPLSGLTDPFGGMHDIKNKIIRCVGDANLRFSEDALRILRALRFSAVLGYTIEDKTKSAAFALAPTLRNISSERKTVEFLKLIEGKNAAGVYTEYIGILRAFLPALPYSGGITEALDKSPADAAPRLAVILDNEEAAHECLQILRLSNALKRKVLHLLSYRSSDIPDTKTKSRKLLAALPRDITPDLLVCYWRVLGRDVDFVKRTFDEIIQNGDCIALSRLEITGDDIAKLGVLRRDIGSILRQLLDAVMEGKVANDKNRLIAYVNENFISKN